MNIKLSEVIIKNLNYLGFSEEFYSGKEKVLKYFLIKDICSILDKDDFVKDYATPMNNEIEIDKIANCDEKVLKISFHDNSYTVKKVNNSLIFINNTLNEVIINIEMSNNLCKNLLTTISDNETIYELQNVYIGENKKFEYSKTIKNSSDERNYTFRMIPLGSKKKDIEYFEFQDLNESNNGNFFIKLYSKINNIVAVHASYKSEDILNNLKNIFEVMENKYQISNIKKLKRK